MNTRALTIEQIHDMMDRSYTLAWLDRSNNLDNSADVISRCLKEKSADPLYEHCNDWFAEIESDRTHEIIEELKSKCIEQGYTDEVVEEFFAENHDAIREEIQSRDDSNILQTLLRNSDDMPIRVEMHSNYDCINSHYFESRYSYQESYFGAMVDALNLNPNKVAEVFADEGIEIDGEFPNIDERNGKELVSYEHFAIEISNSVSPANLLVFIGAISLQELYDAQFDIKQVTLPKGNVCGIFSSNCGGGSLMEMELLHDVTLELNAKPYDYYSLCLDADDNRGYALKEVYGVVDSFFGKPIQIINQAA